VYSHRIINQHHVDSLSNLEQVGQLTLESIRAASDLSLRAMRSQAQAARAWSSALATGRFEVPAGNAQLGSLVQESVSLLTHHYAQLVQLAESQLHLAHRSTHDALGQLQHWVPREGEAALEAFDLAVDAADRSAESFADAVARVVHMVDESSPSE